MYHGKETWKVRRFRDYFEEEEGLKFLESVIRYLYYASDIAEERVIDALKEISEEGGKLSMTIAARLIEKGKITGRMEGRVEGKKEGERKGRIEGKIEGLKEAIEIGLELKYGVEGLKLLERISFITCDDKILKRYKGSVNVQNPIDFVINILRKEENNGN